MAAVTSSSPTSPFTEIPVPTQTHFDSPMCTSGSSTESFTVNCNFESIERTDPITALTPIGVYNLLNFDGINHVHTDPDFDGNHLGLTPYTYPQAASFALGTALESTLPGGGKGSVITSDYIESTISSFTPKSFWYGCVLPSPYTAGSLPADCTITAAGYNKAGIKIASQDFHLQHNGSIVQNQDQGIFKPNFKNIVSLKFGSSRPILTAALIDNFIATLNQESCAPYYKGSYNNGE